MEELGSSKPITQTNVLEMGNFDDIQVDFDDIQVNFDDIQVDFDDSYLFIIHTLLTAMSKGLTFETK